MIAAWQWVIIALVLAAGGMVLNGFLYGMMYRFTDRDPLGLFEL